ncbi:uncharacterized protein V1518DRAFT_418295 [Limtongia smithiae]|uniref:uncharacterized protein n=1 Tax=Limtongia smithiae TaxID=1125753 RepID=UPI0034CEDF3A
MSVEQRAPVADVARAVPDVDALAPAAVAPTATVAPTTTTPSPALSATARDDAVERDQRDGLAAIRAFLQGKTAYDVLPVSFRLIVLDTSLLVRKSLNILLQNAIVSAPLWNSRTSRFAGLLTSADYINVIQYYYQNPDKMDEIDRLTLDGLRDVEKAIGLQPIETVSIEPFRSLYDACLRMVMSKGRRIPLLDYDEEHQREIVLSVLTQYRILKFLAQNCKETRMLRKPLRDLHIGNYQNIATATMDTPVIDVIHLLASKGISSIPIVDADNLLLNVYESVDVLTLVKGGIYNDLKLTVGEALMRRSNDFEGVYTCTDMDRLDTMIDTIRRSHYHRLIVVDGKGRLTGIVTLGDILQYLLLGDRQPDAIAPVDPSSDLISPSATTTTTAGEGAPQAAEPQPPPSPSAEPSQDTPQ